MNKRIFPIISTISNSFNDFTLDILVNKNDMYLTLLLTSIFSFLIQFIYSLITGFSFTLNSIIYLVLYATVIILGYVFYTKSLKYLSVSLTALIESISLFIFLIIDSIFGFIKLNTYFFIIFTIFIISCVLFSYDSFKSENNYKNFNIKGIIFLLLSIFFYTFEPYLIKLAYNKGASFIVINLSYYILAIPVYLLLFKINKEKEKRKSHKLNFKFIFYTFLLSIFESIYFIFGTLGYINESPVINASLHEIRIFLLFFLSVIFKTDKFTFKKLLSLIIGTTMITLIYLY